jgi:hypothetical protein
LRENDGIYVELQKKKKEIERKEIFCRRPKREEIEENQEACC